MSSKLHSGLCIMWGLFASFSNASRSTLILKKRRHSRVTRSLEARYLRGGGPWVHVALLDRVDFYGVSHFPHLFLREKLEQVLIACCRDTVGIKRSSVRRDRDLREDRLLILRNGNLFGQLPV